MKADSIITERLRLRGFTPEDACFAISIWNDPDMGEYLPDESMTEIDPEYLKMVEGLGDDEECCYMIAEDKATLRRIGTCSFIPSPDGSEYDIAYCVHRDNWRKGYATEMVGGMIDYARSHGAACVTVRVNKENVASNRVAAKFGFRVTGETSYTKHGTDRVFTDYEYRLSL